MGLTSCHAKISFLHPVERIIEKTIGIIIFNEIEFMGVKNKNDCPAE